MKTNYSLLNRTSKIKLETINDLFISYMCSFIVIVYYRINRLIVPYHKKKLNHRFTINIQGELKKREKKNN